MTCTLGSFHFGYLFSKSLTLLLYISKREIEKKCVKDNMSLDTL